MKYIIVSRIGKLNSAELSSVEEFYKKYKIKLINSYQLFHTWECYLDGINYELQFYTKLSGKLINKFKFPPPFDKQSFHSECLFTCIVNNSFIDLELDLCNSLLNTLNKKDLYEDNELTTEEYDYSNF